MENLISLFVESVFVNNILLAYFLGMCSFLAVSKRVDTALGLGAAVIFVEVITVPVNWLLNHYLLAPGALAWAGLPDVDLSFLSFISFRDIAVIFLFILESPYHSTSKRATILFFGKHFYNIWTSPSRYSSCSFI